MDRGKFRLAVFGIRTLPPSNGAAGSDTVAEQIYPRLAERGHEVTVYCRLYGTENERPSPQFRGVKLIHMRTVSRAGFDTLLHSLRATFHILIHNTADVVHIHNGGNSIFAIPLRLLGKRVFVAQDGIDWNRAKWRWYARLFLRLSTHLTATVPTMVIFDNIYVKKYFEERFRRSYLFVPYGSDVADPRNLAALEKYGIPRGGYFLFVGRFIPEKGIHYLIEAFHAVKTDKSLVIVGGSPNPNSEYERQLHAIQDPRIRFMGYVYGDEMLQLMKGAYCYVQPSDIEGLSPVILTAMGLAVPIICSNIPENRYAVGNTALLFEKGSIPSLKAQIEHALANPDGLAVLAEGSRKRARKYFSWETIVQYYEEIFSQKTVWDLRSIRREFGVDDGESGS